MKTLIIVAHDDYKQSGTQQFLLHQVPQAGEVTWHLLANDQAIDVAHEQQLLREHQRIIFQFPLYWYSVPVNLRQWQDAVLTKGFAYGTNAILAGKEFGVVVSLGEPLDEYQAGGREHYTISELLKPLQAMANKLNWQYLKPLVISQFEYMTDEQRLALVIDYQQFLTLNDTSFAGQQQWFLNQLRNRINTTQDPLKLAQLTTISEQIEDNYDELAELRWTVDLIRDEEE
ncbi:NAD(P)H-dependent oxidoreductase [Periweissella ghanensis]|uniref:Glutathione-regulated potassium-efflux system ancillary protein KefG n=1 Tax=Periweissella ghanensis TaxID=467997 RepID=A0ABN8BQ44_9LACO|nr:NAD(P)H-dependent oxidoreductase [Periweissella ghanensis]MCM0601662.1 NAD(P)H-dependent oxidoreductase [Periweissella ghanensis]CAH0418741.1 Glutathione-regulated potassium-efflux system ancillary protein KefG [Periweissella ghanensis]